MRWNHLSISKLQRLHRWNLRMDKYYNPTHYNGCNYLTILGLKLIHVSKRASWRCNFKMTLLNQLVVRLRLLRNAGQSSLRVLGATTINMKQRTYHISFLLVFLLSPEHPDNHIRCAEKQYVTWQAVKKPNISDKHRLAHIGAFRVELLFSFAEETLVCICTRLVDISSYMACRMINGDLILDY